MFDIRILENSNVRDLSTTELMFVLADRLIHTNGLDFCTPEQCLELLNLIEEKAYE